LDRNIYIIIFLKDGTQYKIMLGRLIACGTNGNNFFIESKREGRIEIPLDSIDGFKIETTRTYLLYDNDNTNLITAVGILSKHSV